MSNDSVARILPKLRKPDPIPLEELYSPEFLANSTEADKEFMTKLQYMGWYAFERQVRYENEKVFLAEVFREVKKDIEQAEAERRAAAQPEPIGITILPEALSIVRLAQDASIPTWALSSQLFSITKTADELSVVCESALVPTNTEQLIGLTIESGWRALKVLGPLPFTAVGIIASIAAPLAAARISIFTISTFDTDYVLVKKERLASAQLWLKDAGFRVERG